MPNQFSERSAFIYSTHSVHIPKSVGLQHSRSTENGSLGFGWLILLFLTELMAELSGI